MALSKEVADAHFGGLKLEVSKWFDRRKYGVSMLKVLYRDHIKDTLALHECSQAIDITELLTGAGHLTPTNLTLLYETIKLTQQFGLEQLIKERHPSFLIPKDIKNIEITKFTPHRQRLVNLGMALSFYDIQYISRLYSVAEEQSTNSWSLIMALEQRLVICEGEMEAFINILKENGFLMAVKALTEDTTIMVNKHKHTATSLDSDNMAACDYTIIKGKHKPNISEPSEAVEKANNECINKIQDDFKAVNQNPIKLEENKTITLRDIDNYVQVIIIEIEENEDKIKKEVEIIYQQRKAFLDIKMQELEAAMKSNEATAKQLSRITALKEGINELSRTLDFLKQCDNKNIKYLRTADYLRLEGIESVTENETIVVRIIKTEECEIYAFQLKATWTLPTSEITKAQVQEDDNGDYFVTGQFTSPGVHKLDVTVDDKPIKHSPMLIKVKKGLLKTIKVRPEMYVHDVAKYNVDDCLLVSCGTNEILKYKQSGEYFGKITLPQDVNVFKMITMKNGNIVFSANYTTPGWYTSYTKFIKIRSMNGEIKSIELLKKVSAIHVDEESNVVYVTTYEENTNDILMFNINSGQPIKNMGSPFKEIADKISDFTSTNQGHFLILIHSELHLFDNEGRFKKILVQEGSEDGEVYNAHSVVVDEDDNIIVSCNNRLQLFSSDGNFIKRIDKPEDEIFIPKRLSIISYHPRRLAVVNNGDSTVRIFNY